MLRQRLQSYYSPSPIALTFTWVAVFELAVFAALLAVITFASTTTPQGALLVMSFTGCPFAAFLLVAAALAERRRGPRTLIWLAITVLSLGGSVGALASMAAIAPGSALGSIVLFTGCCLPMIFAPAGMTVFFALRSWPELRAILRTARYQRLLEMIQARGVAAFDEVANELSLPEPRAVGLLQEFIASGELMAYLDANGRKVYSVAALAEKQRLLAAVVQAHGQISLQKLSEEVSITEELARTWLYQLVQRGLFHGVFDWERSRVYSLDAEELARQGGRCLHCGGILDLAGKGVIQCAYCGVEVFV